MAAKKNTATSPLTIDLPQSLVEKIAAQQAKHGLDSASAVVREALLQFNPDSCAFGGEPHKQISVRLPADLKAKLVRAARKKKTSVGAFLRIALEAFDAKPAPKKGARK